MRPTTAGNVASWKARTGSIARTLLAASALPYLAACATPFAQSTSIDWTRSPGAGTITLSEPKMYRREALINERNDEVAWLNRQLTDSEKMDFKPEILREIETVSAFSAALGLNFDPAAGLNYRRAAATGDLQQEIATMRLQLQLDQLKRDAELAREKFAAQAEPVNANLTTLGDGSVGTATSMTAASAADQLAAAIGRLTALTSRLDAESKPIAAATSGVNPADTFRDRAAYRDLLKGARNAASLDELHDVDGAVLVRLNFEATVIPDRRFPRSPGVVQMEVRPPELKATDKAQLYAGWLNHLNETLNVQSAGEWKADWRVLNSAAADNFDTLPYLFAPTASATGCNGPAIDRSPSSPPAPTPQGCATLQLAVPWFVGLARGEEAYQTLQAYLRSFMLPSFGDGSGRSEEEEIKADAAFRQQVVESAPVLAAGCGLTGPGVAASVDPDGRLDGAIALARTRAAAGEALQQAVRAAERQLSAAGIVPPSGGDLDRIRLRTRRAEVLIATYKRLSGFDSGRCDAQARGFAAAGPRRLIPIAFDRLVSDSTGRARVYEVGPREQVQQVSTVARAANSLALAVSLAASAPGSGAAGNAAAGYSRQAMGKAAQLERLPANVGFIEPMGKFGWVIGPHATVDPKGRLELAHSLRPQDLSVDFAVPGWWPYFRLATVTGWAPSPDQIATGQATGRSDEIRVPMSQNRADYAAISALLAKADFGWSREVALKGLDSSTIYACRPTTLLIEGDNVWRATSVLIGGVKLSDKALAIAPDMSGVLVDVPALESALGASAADRQDVSVLTPYGADRRPIRYERPAAGCKPESPAKDGPSVSGVQPVRFRGSAPIRFTVSGAKLDRIDRVALNGQPGALKAAADGKSLTVDFTAEQTSSLPISRSNPLEISKGDDVVDRRMIEVTGKAGDE